MNFIELIHQILGCTSIELIETENSFEINENNCRL